MYSLKEILDRLKSHFKCKNFKEVAKIIGVKYQTLTTWLQRNKIPFELLHKIAQNENLSFDWLLTGKGSMRLQEPAIAQNTNIHNSTVGVVGPNQGTVITGHNQGTLITGNINISIQKHKKEVTQKEDELLEAYRTLPSDLQDYYYYQIKADAIKETRKKEIK